MQRILVYTQLNIDRALYYAKVLSVVSEFSPGPASKVGIHPIDRRTLADLE
jgi:hypothetical protein